MGLFILAIMFNAVPMDGPSYVCVVASWSAACALMFWARAYRDVMVARATGRCAEDVDEDEEGEEEGQEG